MQTVDRAKLIVRAHVNDLLAKAEDTRQTRLLALEEMRQDIRSVKSLVAHAITDLKLMERKLDETEAEATRWEEKAVFALKKGEEDLARRALVRKCELMKRGNQYREQLATQREAIDSLKASLKTLEVKLDIMPYRSVPKLAVAESREEQRQPVALMPPEVTVIQQSIGPFQQLLDVREAQSASQQLRFGVAKQVSKPNGVLPGFQAGRVSGRKERNANAALRW